MSENTASENTVCMVIEALMLVVERGGDAMLPSIGIMRAQYPGGTAPTPRRKRAKKYRVVS